MKKKFEIVPIRDEIDRVFEDMANAMENFRRNFFRMFREPFLEEEPEVLKPSIDIIDNGESYEVAVDIPGFDKNDIEINVSENEIEIKGEKKKEKKEEKKNYLRRERSYMSFYRQTTLPEEIIPDESQAKLENGVLKITLKKKNPTPLKKKEFKKLPIQ